MAEKDKEMKPESGGLRVQDLKAALPLVNLGAPLFSFMRSDPILWESAEQVGPYILNKLQKTFDLLTCAGISAIEITGFVEQRCLDEDLPFSEEQLGFLSKRQRAKFLKAQTLECIQFLPKEHKIVGQDVLLPFVFDPLEGTRKGRSGSVRKVLEGNMDLCSKRLPWDTNQHKVESAAELGILLNIPVAPHLLQLRASYIQGAYHYLVLDPWVTTDLTKFMAAPDSFPFWRGMDHNKPLLVISWFRCIAAALATMHSHLLKHIDLKPANIGLLIKGDTVTPFLLDYGHSRSFDRNSQSQAMEVAGALYYRSPEKLQNKLEGRNGEVFSLGVVFMELLGLLSPGIKRKWKRLVKSTRDKLPALSILGQPRWADDFFSEESKTAQKLGAVVVEMLLVDPDVRPSANDVYRRLDNEWGEFVACHCRPADPSPVRKKQQQVDDDQQVDSEEEPECDGKDLLRSFDAYR